MTMLISVVVHVMPDIEDRWGNQLW